MSWDQPESDRISKMLTERGNIYGDYTGHAMISQGLKAVMQRTDGWARLNDVQCETLEMIAHKIGRILNGDPNVQDHWDDIAGYSKLVADRIKK